MINYHKERSVLKLMTASHRVIGFYLFCFTLITCVYTSVHAVKPGVWSQRSEQEFSENTLEDTVITTRGDLILSRKTTELFKLQEEDTIIFDMVAITDTSYVIAAGPKGKLLFWDGEKLETWATYEDEQVYSISHSGEMLYIAISGVNARIEQRKLDGELVSITPVKDIFFIWECLITDEGIYLATGTPGKVLFLPKDQLDKPKLVLELKQPNILSLAISKTGVLFAGTDGEGLVYRIDPIRDQNKVLVDFESFVLYDANEPEIGSILVNADGSIYIGTADAEGAKPERMTPPAEERTGEEGDPETTAPEESEPVESLNESDESTEEEVVVDVKVETPNGGNDADVEKETENQQPTTTPALQGSAQDQSQKGDRIASKRIAPPTDFKLKLANREFRIAINNEDDHDRMVEVILRRVVTKLAEEGKRPTPQQYEKLRKVISKRLDDAREKGEMVIKASDMSTSRGGATNRTSKGSSSSDSSSGGDTEGNAIYHIDTLGFATQVFRESVMIMDIKRLGQYLLVGTANGGELYQVNPVKKTFTLLKDFQSNQIMKLVSLSDGATLIAMANVGAVQRMDEGYIAEGSMTSKVMDASYLSLWGNMKLDMLIQLGTTVEIQTRSSNVSDTEAAGWSSWSAPVLLEPRTDGMPSEVSVTSPPARYLQYRITLKSKGEATSVFQGFSMKYLTLNRAPKITALKVEPDDDDKSVMVAAWEASDPNEDALTYALYVKRIGSKQGFLKIADGITENKQKLNEMELPGGRYIVKVVASDAMDNAPGREKMASYLSEPVVIDLDFPDISNPVITHEKEGTVIKATVTDPISDIEEVRYQINGQGSWIYVLPNDMIYDSTTESFSITISNLSPGTHLINIRVVDAAGNTRIVAKTLQIPEKE